MRWTQEGDGTEWMTGKPTDGAGVVREHNGTKWYANVVYMSERKLSIGPFDTADAAMDAAENTLENMRQAVAIGDLLII